MNVVALVGRLVRDPELRYTGSGVATCTFTLAVENPFAKQDPKADFISIVTWKQTAEACANFLRKGRLCSVEGRISTRNYEKDGHKVYVTEIQASNVRFLEKAENRSDNTLPPAADDAPIDIDEDLLPF
jgi:single-strand DNA-binding protein